MHWSSCLNEVPGGVVWNVAVLPHKIIATADAVLSFSTISKYKLATSKMPTQPVSSLRTSIKLTFPDGIELTSLFDPVTSLHFSALWFIW